jgi:hypothetical protein
MVRVFDAATGVELPQVGNAEARRKIATILNLDGQGQIKLIWRVKADYYAVVRNSRGQELRNPTFEDAAAARAIAESVPPNTRHKDLLTYNLQMRRHQFGLVYRDRNGAWRGAPPNEKGRPETDPRLMAVRVLEGELRVEQEKEAYAEGSLAKAAKSVENWAATAETSDGDSEADEVEDLLARAVRKLEGAPWTGQINGTTIAIIPPPSAGRAVLPTDLNVSKHLRYDKMLPVVEELIRAGKPVIPYEVNAKLLGIRLDPNSREYKTRVMQAFSREYDVVLDRLRADHYSVDVDNSGWVYYEGGAKSRSQHFRRVAA